MGCLSRRAARVKRRRGVEESAGVNGMLEQAGRLLYGDGKYELASGD
jgi:hypothetical protein